jgi:2-keto-3-deoxy-galactonokinase
MKAAMPHKCCPANCTNNARKATSTTPFLDVTVMFVPSIALLDRSFHDPMNTSE